MLTQNGFLPFGKCCSLFTNAFSPDKLRYCNVLTSLEFYKWSFQSEFNKTHNCKKRGEASQGNDGGRRKIIL